MSKGKMLILPGVGNHDDVVYQDDCGKPNSNYVKGSGTDEERQKGKTFGALHDLYAKKFAEWNHYDPEVLNVSGEAYTQRMAPMIPQVQAALTRLKGKGGKDYKALYGFSGGGYNILPILEHLSPGERDNLDIVIVLAAPGSVEAYKKLLPARSDGTPRVIYYDGKSGDSSSYNLPPFASDKHMFLPWWLLSQDASHKDEFNTLEKDRQTRCSK